MSELEWLQNAPCSGLLETDIRSKSFNLVPWNGKSSSPDVGTTWKSERLVLEDNQFFQNLQIGDTMALEAISQRSTCPKCDKSRKYYCYSCYIPLKETANLIPMIPSLPIQIDVIKHPHELDGKVSLPNQNGLLNKDVKVNPFSELCHSCQSDLSEFCPGFYLPEYTRLSRRKSFGPLSWRQISKTGRLLSFAFESYTKERPV